MEIKKAIELLDYKRPAYWRFPSHEEIDEIIILLKQLEKIIKKGGTHDLHSISTS